MRAGRVIATSGQAAIAAAALTLMTDLLFSGRRVVMESRLGIDDVTRRLQLAIAPPEWLRPDRRTEPFEGTFDNGRFRIMRRVKGRNSFRPVIDGVLAPSQLGTRVDLQLRLHPVVVAFCTVMLGIGLLIAAVALYSSIATRTIAPELVVLAIITIAALLVSATAALEVRRAVRLLRDLLDVQVAVSGR